MDVKENNQEIEVKTEVTTAVALVAPNAKEELEIKSEDLASSHSTKESRGKKRKGTTEGVVHASSTAETRRVSKRLRR